LREYVQLLKNQMLNLGGNFGKIIDKLSFNSNTFSSSLWENYINISEFVVSAVLYILLLALQNTLIGVPYANQEDLRQLLGNHIVTNFST